MKFKGLFIALAAAVASLLVACQKEKPVFGISVDKDVIEFTQSGGQAQVQVTTAQAWNVSIPADAQAWLSAEPTSGTGKAVVKASLISFSPYWIISLIGIILCGIFLKDFPEQCGAYRDNDRTFTPEMAQQMLVAEQEARARSVWKRSKIWGCKDWWLQAIPNSLLLSCAMAFMVQIMKVLQEHEAELQMFVVPGFALMSEGYTAVLFGLAIFACFGSWLLGVLDTKYGVRTAVFITSIVMLIAGILGMINNVICIVAATWMLGLFMGASSATGAVRTSPAFIPARPPSAPSSARPSPSSWPPSAPTWAMPTPSASWASWPLSASSATGPSIPGASSPTTTSCVPPPVCLWTTSWSSVSSARATGNKALRKAKRNNQTAGPLARRSERVDKADTLRIGPALLGSNSSKPHSAPRTRFARTVRFVSSMMGQK